TDATTAREIHVAKAGRDSDPGDRDNPYLTISRAAQAAKPGDTVIVHAGTYREWVKPAHGGTGEDRRITYRAAAGEKVVIKGSERITPWTRQEAGVWKVELANTMFGDYNPYALKLSGGWLNYGKWHHRGDVYLNGEAFYEKETAEEVGEAAQSWHCRTDDKITTIRANFGDANPNNELTEINVRESLFMPEVTGLKYITVDGFHFMHAAANWAPPVIELQTGAVGPRMGKHWIIQNCTVVNARCVGIILGQAPGVDYEDIDAYGDHIVRNNIIKRCGQAGIAGQKGATRSLISGNFIEETNYRREFGGWETAAIKLHNSVDTLITNNLIRGVYHQQQAAFGIWMDYANQGTRITRNIIYDTEAETVFLEMNHGPALIDNNILVSKGLRSNSEATIIAHNLLVDSWYKYQPDVKRRSSYYTPHTTISVGRKTGTAKDERWYNNIFVRRGLDDVKDAPGYESDYNVFYEGAQKSSFGDEHSAVDAFAAGFAYENSPLGVTIRFSVNDGAFGLNGPWVDKELVGVFSTVGQSIEDRHGNPIKVNADFNGRRYSRPIPGPLADLKQGANEIIWTFKKHK
ncbi:MAG: right-handed parallel beta-helix repeat-containing protein, partial [Planctomycetota bacterium]